MNDPLGLFEESKGPNPLGLFAEDEATIPGAIKRPKYEDKSTLADKALGVGEAALSVASSIPASIYAGAVGLAHKLRGGDMDEAANASMEANTYAPRTEKGKDYADVAGDVMQQLMPNLVPMTPHLGAMRGFNKGVEPVKARIEIPKEPEAVVHSDPLHLFDETSQMELPDSAMIQAPQYGVHDGMGRVDENGMPIRADLSMDVQNMENPLQRNLWGDELDTPTGDGGIPLTQALDSMPDLPWKGDRDVAIESLTGEMPATGELLGAMDEANPLSMTTEGQPLGMGMRRLQGGGIDFEGISSSLGNLVGRFTGNKPVKADTVVSPRSPENIAKKTDLANKAAAVGYKGSVYERINTPEEVLANLGKDITNNPVRDYVKPGVEGMIRTNTSNPLLKFTRTKFQDARNLAEEYSKKYVTGKEGFNQAYRALSKDEWLPVAEALQDASRERIPLTEDVMNQMGFNDKQKLLISRAQGAMDAMYNMGNDALLSQGFDPIKYHPGYVPSMFSGAYTTLVGKRTPEGKMIIKGIAQGDTKAQMAAAVEHYKTQGLTDTIALPRKGLKDTSFKANRVYDGFNDIVKLIAENDPDFANLKAEADQAAAGKIKALYKFDVHEKNKTGVKGSLGDRPWLTRDQNAKQFLEGLVGYMEEGSRYYAMQGALNDVGQLKNNPEVQAQLPNTVKYLDRYTRHVTGQNLSPLGAAGNWMIDALPSLLGVAPGYLTRPMGALRNVATLQMMGFFNLAFTGMQLTQGLTGGLPEGLKIAGDMGLPAGEFAKSVSTIGPDIGKVLLQEELGHNVNAPAHLTEGYKFAKDHGMFDFSETELARDVLKSKTVSNLENVVAWPITLGEKATRPPVFLWFVDLMHKGGLEGKEMLSAAQSATDYAMANYHPDERPMLYSSFGTMGQFMGALTTFKHNLLDQMTSRTMDVGKGKILPAAAMIGLGYGLYGLSGIPGYQEADQVTQATTGKTIREMAFDTMPYESLWDGLLSAKTGIDFQSRLSMASIAPDTPGSLLSPQLASMANIMGKAYEYGRNPDQQSFTNMAMAAAPAGLRGAVETQLNQDSEGFVKNKFGQRKYVSPRSESETLNRAATGLRPLRERLEDEDVYADSQQQKRVTTKQKEIVSRLESAIIRQDAKAVPKYAQDYIDAGGDISKVLTSQQIETYMVRSKMSERQRRQGTPTDLNSINRYKEYND